MEEAYLISYQSDAAVGPHFCTMKNVFENYYFTCMKMDEQYHQLDYLTST